MTGTVSPLYEPAMLLKRAGVIPGHDMTSEAALAKLSYLLALPGLSTKDIVQQMLVSLRGEFTEQTNIVFEHPPGMLSSHRANLSSLGYAISKGSVLETQDLLKGDLGWLLNEADYSGNTPLVSPSYSHLQVMSAHSRSQHVAATGPSLEILRTLLTKGASVHLRNNTGRTPLFLAANADLVEHVSLLRESGAHLHAEEIRTAKLHAQNARDVWRAAGI